MTWHAGEPRWRSAILGICLVLGLNAAAFAAVADAEPGRAQVVVGAARGQIGAGVFVPVSLVADGDVRIGSMELRISFPRKMLKKVNVIPGIDGAAVGASIAAEDEGSNDEAVVTLTVALPRDGAADSLPTGVLAELLFSIEREAEVGRAIVLKNSVKAWSAGDDKRELAMVKGEDGRVDVTSTPLDSVYSCFFYMH